MGPDVFIGPMGLGNGPMNALVSLGKEMGLCLHWSYGVR